MSRFACVVGEFDIGSYQIPDGVATDPVPFLKSHGFVMVRPNSNSKERSFVNTVWVNTRLYKRFKARDYMCDVMGGSGIIQHRNSTNSFKGVGHLDVMEALDAARVKKA